MPKTRKQRAGFSWSWNKKQGLRSGSYTQKNMDKTNKYISNLEVKISGYNKRFL